MTQATTPVYSANGVEILFGDMPYTSVVTLLNRALSHIFSNEVPKEIRKDDAKAAEWRAAKLLSILEGKLGVRKSGEPKPKPSRDPIALIAAELSEKAVLDVVSRKGWKVSKVAGEDGKKVLTISTADGTVIKTLAKAVADRLAHAEHGPKLLDAAKAEHARRIKASEKATADAGDEI